MNADLTFNTIVFKKSFDTKDESERRSTTRGQNIPDVMIIKSQDYVDSATKVPGRRYTARVDLYNIDANLAQIVTSCYFVFAVPVTAETADVTNVTTTFKALVADAGFMAAVLNNEK